MRVKISANPLPKKWSTMKGADRASMIANVKVTSGSRLTMKLFVFENKTDLKYFWRHGLGFGNLGARCIGVVRNLNNEVMSFNGDKTSSFLEVDPVYFAFMGLVKKTATTEVIAHESVHAAFAYVERLGNRLNWPDKNHNPEEKLCYPVGRIAQGVSDLIKELNETTTTYQ